MSKERATFAILFADIAQSTKLYENHGDTISQGMITSYLDALTGVATAHNGRVIKTIGDEVMCVFPRAQDAVEAAKNMPSAVEHVALAQDAEVKSQGLYIGIHYGSVIVDQGDIFGDAVNVAARMVSLAKPNQIIVTQETVDALPSEYGDCVRCVDKTRIKGKQEVMLIFEVLCARETATLTVKAPEDSIPDSNARLELMIADKRMEINTNFPVKTLGRQSQNDIIVNDYRVSRSHARIEFRKGKFYLVDHSTNGTYVARDGVEQVLLRMDEMRLEGSGIIGLYDSLEANSPDAIHYSVQVM